jgi:hypothetical protein
MTDEGEPQKNRIPTLNELRDLLGTLEMEHPEKNIRIDQLINSDVLRVGYAYWLNLKAVGLDRMSIEDAKKRAIKGIHQCMSSRQ